MQASLLTDAELAQAAFHLLTSSSLDRYARKAAEATGTSRVSELIASCPERIPEVAARARSLWQELLRAGRRDTPEFELAVLLCALGRAPNSAVNGLLTDIALLDAPGVAWVSALARKLRLERADNVQVSFAPDTGPALGVGNLRCDVLELTVGAGEAVLCRNANAA